jgi:exodeoxyribonuclease V alpha subunit
MKPAPAESPDLVLAEGFARQTQAWALAQSAPDSAARALRQAAHALSLATSNGDVCILISELARTADGPGDAAAWRQALLASGVVGTDTAPASFPLVLDADGRLYLHRYFDYERRLAQRLTRACLPGAVAASGPGTDTGTGTSASPALSEADRPALRNQLDHLFAANAEALGGAPDWQKIAAALALRGRLAIISGGPGTGKTTTVVNLLACLIAQNPACRIALAAPTGKAAARMTDAVRQRAAHLPEAIRGRLPTESFTIHRLLGVTPAAGGFVHHAGNPLPIDALVVDEASMLDLALATKLLEAVPATARIVLLGDKDQLSAVESGAVFAELSADPSLSRACRDDLAALCGIEAERIVPPAPALPGALRDAVVWFTYNFRFAGDSAIGRLASGINGGCANEVLAALRAAHDPAVCWVDDVADARSTALAEQIMQGYAPYLAAVRSGAADPHAVFDAFGRFRALCALREGPRGVVAVNADVTRRFRAALGALDREERSAWFPGRPVLVLRNDYVLKLFNGDIGFTLPGKNGEPMVFFPQPDGGFRAIAPVRLPAHETAFAMTVHKSQGSEFDEVLVLLPTHPSRVLTRELLYTAVTRARQRVTLCAGSAVLAGAIATSTRRHSGLLARLRGA